MGSTNSSEFIDIKKMLDKYLKYWYVFIIAGVICLGLGVTYLSVVSPKVQVYANILIKEDSKGVSGGMAAMAQNFALSSMLGTSGTSINDEILILSSFTSYRKMGQELGLNTIYKLNKFPLDKECYKTSPLVLSTTLPIADTFDKILTFDVHVDSNQKSDVKVKWGRKTIAKVESPSFPVKIETEFGDFYLTKTDLFVPSKSFSMKITFMGYDLMAEILQKRIEVDQLSKKANMISLGIVDPISQRGKDILNNLVYSYNNNSQEDKNNESDIVENFLNERIALIESELDSVERDLEEYKKKNNLTDIEVEAKIIIEKSSDFKEKLIEAEAQFTVIELVEQFLLKEENRYSMIPLNIGLSDRTVLEGLQQYNEALLNRIRLMRTTKMDNPALELANSQIDAMRDNMLATIRSLKSGFVQSRNDLKAQEDYFLSRIGNMPTQEREFINIKRQQEIKQELFLILLQKREENSLMKAVVKPKAKIVDNAYVLSTPVSPKLSVVFGISLLFTLILSLVVISLLELRKRRLAK